MGRIPKGCEGCKDAHLDPSDHPCCDCSRCNDHSERDLYSPANVGCFGCTNYHTEGTQFPCCECKRINDKKTTDHYYEESKSDPVNHPAEDPVNHPKHYADTCSLECIDVMLIAFGKDAVISFCMCNAFKYMWRFKNKNGQEDLQKAKWYLNKAEDLGPDDYIHDQILCLCATVGRLNRGKEND